MHLNGGHAATLESGYCCSTARFPQRRYLCQFFGNTSISHGVQVLDAEGKDRTPKPMLVFRAAGPLRPGGSVMGSDSFQDAGGLTASSNPLAA